MPLDCNGTRVWEGFGPAYFIHDSPASGGELYFSEGGSSVAGIEGSATPCLVMWSYLASENCSMPFTSETFFDELAASFPSDFEAGITSQGALAISYTPNPQDPSTARTELYPTSGVSLSQLSSAAECSMQDAQ